MDDTRLECEAARCPDVVVAIVKVRGDWMPVCEKHISWAQDWYYPRKGRVVWL
jgi:hypothetical protein